MRVIPELSAIRARIVAIVEAYPGLTVQDVARIMGFSHPTAAYHLTGLSSIGVLSRSRDGRVLRHYALPEPNRGEAYLKALERDERRRPIIEFLCAGAVESMSVNQMRHHLGLPYGLIKRTLTQLEREGLVSLRIQRNVYSVTPLGALRKRRDAFMARPAAPAPIPGPHGAAAPPGPSAQP